MCFPLTPFYSCLCNILPPLSFSLQIGNMSRFFILSYPYTKELFSRIDQHLFPFERKSIAEYLEISACKQSLGSLPAREIPSTYASCIGVSYSSNRMITFFPLCTSANTDIANYCFKYNGRKEKRQFLSKRISVTQIFYYSHNGYLASKTI